MRCLRRRLGSSPTVIALFVIGLLAGACGPSREGAEPPANSPTPGSGAANSLAVIEPVTPCESLIGFDLTAIGGSGSRVTSATLSTNEKVAVCAVEGVLAPSIGFQLLLPSETWTQRYLQAGCGGLCGHISLRVSAAEGCAPVEAGELALASTDMGHQGRGGEFGRAPQERIDFAHRSVHLTAVASKALIEAFYGQPATYSYFTGCSDGGREALMEAQRYPDDFDGIVAGAPAMNFQVQNSFYHAWQARSNTDDTGSAILEAERLPILHEAVLAACDEDDGLKDGLITDPRSCEFDPASVQCEEGRATDGCLTAAEVEAARRLYAGPRDADSGQPLTLGGPQPGSELSWAGVFVPRAPGERIFSEQIALDALRNVIFEENPPEDYGIEDLAFDSATFDSVRSLHGLYDATDPDLGPFDAAGGKLILWHGWSDPHISPINTITYYEAVESVLGPEEASSTVRLFLFPGMYHCSRGEGPHRFDLLTPLMHWVESGRAPEVVVARQGGEEPSDREGRGDPVEEEIERSRPAFPYPSVATYRGKGPLDQASSFVAAEGARGPSAYEWLGRDFLTPGQALDCAVEGALLVCRP